MRKGTLGLFFLMESVIALYAQNGSNLFASKYLKLKIDTINIEITNHKKWSDTVASLQMRIVNQTQDTIQFMTNSCPSYRVYQAHFQNRFKIPNEDTRCNGNSKRCLTILPDSSIKLTEKLWVLDNALTDSSLFVLMVLPLKKETEYRQNFSMLYYQNEYVKNMSYDIVTHPESIVYVGNVPVKMNIIDNRKKKKKQRRKK